MKRGGGLRRSWTLLAIAAVVAALLFAADEATRNGPHGGFVPAQVDWVLRSDDLPGVWQGLNDTDFLRALREETQSPLDVPVLELRKLTGIRMTPLRWRLWCGDRFAAASVNGAQVLSLRPGLLTRAAEPALRYLNGFTNEQGMIRAGDVFYAWREGYVIVSQDRALIASCLAQNAIRLDTVISPKTMRWEGDFAGESFELALTASERLPFEVALEGVEAPPTGLSQIPTGPWNGEIARIQGLPFRKYQDMAKALTERHTSRRTKTQIADIMQALPPDAPNSAIVLTAIETSDFRALAEPRLMLVAEPVDAVPIPPDNIPFLWSGLDGWVLPWWGQSFTLCHAAEGARVFYASAQPVMLEHLSAARVRQNGPAGRIYVNWQRVSDHAQHLILKAADFELFKGLNRQDASAVLLPYARAAETLGETVLSGTFTDGRLVLKGDLAAPIEAMGS